MNFAMHETAEVLYAMKSAASIQRQSVVRLAHPLISERLGAFSSTLFLHCQVLQLYLQAKQSWTQALDEAVADRTIIPGGSILCACQQKIGGHAMTSRMANQSKEKDRGLTDNDVCR